MLARGVPLIVVSRHLDHTDVNVTARVCARSQAERDISAVALGLRAPGMHLRGIEHLAPPKPPK